MIRTGSILIATLLKIEMSPLKILVDLHLVMKIVGNCSMYLCKRQRVEGILDFRRIFSPIESVNNRIKRHARIADSQGSAFN